MRRRLCVLLFLVLCLARSAAATETRYEALRALPAPGKVTIDGGCADWDLSGGLFICGDVEKRAADMSAWFHVMYDKDNLYVLVRWADATPLNNPGGVDSDPGWKGDCLQFRFITAPGTPNEYVCHLDAWRDRDRKSVLEVGFGREFEQGVIKDLIREGGREAFAVWPDAKGYFQEISVPWKLLVTGDPPTAGEKLRATVQLNFTLPDSALASVYDLIASGYKGERPGMHARSGQWGAITLEAKGPVEPEPVRLDDGRTFKVTMKDGRPAVDWAGAFEADVAGPPVRKDAVAPETLKRIEALVAQLGNDKQRPQAVLDLRSLGNVVMPVLLEHADDPDAPRKKAVQELLGQAAEPGPAAPAAAGTDTLRLLGGDVLHGKLVSASADGLVWDHPDAVKPITFSLKGVSEIRLGSVPRLPAGQQPCLVGLADGSSVRGRLSALTAKALSLDTDYAGTLTIPREAVRELTLAATGEAATYEGPTDMKDWRTIQFGGQKGAWRFKNAAFYASGRAGGIGRSFQIPERFRIEFDTEWRGYPQMQLYALSDQISTNPQSGFIINFNNTYLYIQRRDRQRGFQQIGNVNVQDMMRSTRARIALLGDKKKKVFYLKVGDKVVQQWSDAPDAPALGNAVVFICQGNSAMKISNIVIGAWDGVVQTAASDEKPGPRDVVIFANEDKVTGDVQAVSGGKVMVKTEFTPIEVPLARVSMIRFKAAPAKTMPKGAEYVNVQLRAGGEFALRFTKLEGDVLTGESPLFGPAQIKLGALERLLFNMGQKPKQEDEDEDW